MSALSLPPRAQDKLALLVAEHWIALKEIPSLEVAKYVTAPSRMPALVDFTAEQIWAAIEVARTQSGNASKAEDADLKIAEWAVLTQNPLPPPTKDFRVTRVPAPTGSGSAH